MAEATEKPVIRIPEFIVVRDLAQKLQVTPAKLVALLVKNGLMLNMNERVDFVTAQILADDFGFTLARADASGDQLSAQEEKAKELLTAAKVGNLKPRPPVVVVMGHVDHGKTTLLDAIRKTNVAAKEAGAITQHIGAYQVEHKGRSVTFIDTPGHEAFTAMRSRGANVADVAILVVAADDGIQPQTKEAIEIIKRNHLGLVVAINKVDKPEADIDRVKGALAEVGLTPEDWSGQTVTAAVSAKQGKGIDELLEMVLLVADLEKERISADPVHPAIGTIIESHVDKGEGPVATAIIQSGTLKVGDYIQVGDVAGKVKALRDYRNSYIGKAPPSTPARILGLKELPQVGDILQVVAAQDVKDSLRKRKKQGKDSGTFAGVAASVSVATSDDEVVAHKVLPLIIKADAVGSLEAITAALDDLRHPEVAYKILYRSLGNITEKDILQAEATGALLLGFNVIGTIAAEEVARSRQITFHAYKVLYDLLAAVRKRMEELLDMETIETIVGELEVRAVFRTDKRGMIVGGMVREGEVGNGVKFRIERAGAVVGKGTLTQVQRGPDKVKQVGKGTECGVQFSGDAVVQVGDRLVCFMEELRKRTLETSTTDHDRSDQTS